jgi:hypothetical protein
MLTYETTSIVNKHLVCDLEPGEYSVRKDGNFIPDSPFTVTSANTLYFEADGSGSFEVAPSSGAILINNGDEYFNSRDVTLTLSPPDPRGMTGPITEMMFRNEDLVWSNAFTYSDQHTWLLSDGDGEKTVYAKFKDSAGNWTDPPISDTIILDTVKPGPPSSPTSP